MPATPPPVATLSWTDARRIAPRAQGIGGSRRTAVASPARSREALAATFARTQLLQIDSVSVFARAHHLPAFTRHGSWDTRVLDRAAASPSRTGAPSAAPPSAPGTCSRTSPPCWPSTGR